MKAENFCYWLQGHFEMNPTLDSFTPEQVATMRKHLDMVFVHIDAEFPAEQQAALSAAHDGGEKPLGGASHLHGGPSKPGESRPRC